MAQVRLPATLRRLGGRVRQGRDVSEATVEDVLRALDPLPGPLVAT